MAHRSPNLKLVSEAQAEGRIGELFADIKQVLGIPYVGLVFLAYAAYPPFLELFWQSVRLGVLDAQFFGLAGRLRASAYTRVFSYFFVPDFSANAEQIRLSPGARQELSSTIDLLYYHAALQLLLAEVALLAFDRLVGRAPLSPQKAEPPAFRVRPVLVGETAATPRVARIYDEIKRALGAPIVNADFRAFARFPDFLEDYWAVLRPIIDSPLYRESQFGVQDTVVAVARDFPAEVSLGKERLEDVGIGDDAIAAVVRATELFVKILSSALLSLAIAKIGFDGGTTKQPRVEQAIISPRAA